jgi:hypothetical protein
MTGTLNVLDSPQLTNLRYDQYGVVITKCDISVPHNHGVLCCRSRVVNAQSNFFSGALPSRFHTTPSLFDNNCVAGAVQRHECALLAQCPAGWVPHVSDGIDTHDICIMMVADAAGTVADDSVCSTASSGAHLITIEDSASQATAASSLVSLVTRLVGPGNAAWVGLSQSPLSSSASGWSWLGGGSTANVNCGTPGCGLWGPGQPL